MYTIFLLASFHFLHSKLDVSRQKLEFVKWKNSLPKSTNLCGPMNSSTITLSALVRFTNFNSVYLNEPLSGVNLMNRTFAKSVPASTQIVKLSENEYSLNTIIPSRIHQQKFVPGQEITQTTIDGRKIKNIFTIEGNTLIERQIEPNRETIIIRKFFETEMLAKFIVGDVTNRHWNKLEDWAQRGIKMSICWTFDLIDVKLRKIEELGLWIR